jgi:hypothetical protein
MGIYIPILFLFYCYISGSESYATFFLPVHAQYHNFHVPEVSGT